MRNLDSHRRLRVRDEIPGLIAYGVQWNIKLTLPLLMIFKRKCAPLGGIRQVGFANRSNLGLTYSKCLRDAVSWFLETFHGSWDFGMAWDFGIDEQPPVRSTDSDRGEISTRQAFPWPSRRETLVQYNSGLSIRSANLVTSQPTSVPLDPGQDSGSWAKAAKL
jgi:hypothetical protein